MAKHRSQGVDENRFQTALREMIRHLVHTQMDMAALEVCLTERGVMSEEDLRQAREKLKLQMKTLLDSLERSTPHELFALLRGLEGPIQ